MSYQIRRFAFPATVLGLRSGVLRGMSASNEVFDIAGPRRSHGSSVKGPMADMEAMRSDVQRAQRSVLKAHDKAK